MRAGQLPLELFAQRPGADDHEAGARQVREHPQVPDLLLVRQPPHEAHELLAVRGELGAQRLVPLGGMESAGVDAAAPQVHASHPWRCSCRTVNDDGASVSVAMLCRRATWLHRTSSSHGAPYRAA